MLFARHFLLNSIKKELRYESSLDKNIIYLTEFVRKHGIVQKTTDSSPKINLYKQFPPYKIQIEFYQRTPKKIFTEEEKEEGSRRSKYVGDDVCPLYISVQRNPDENLHIEFFSVNSLLWPQHTLFTKEMPENVNSLFVAIRGRVNYNSLNERVQTEFVEWLKSIGITEDLGKFVEIMSLHKEREHYKRWLNGLVEILQEEETIQ